MRRLTSLLLGMFAMFFVTQIAHAEEYTTYHLNELTLNFEIDIPANTHIITRDTPEDDPIFAKIGTTGEELLGYMEGNNIYLDIVFQDVLSEIVVIMSQSAISDFSELDEDYFDTIRESMTGSSSLMGMTNYETCDYTREPLRYIVSTFEVEQDVLPSYRKQYYTAYKGTALHFLLISYSPEDLEEQSEVLKQIVDSVRFVDDPSAEEPQSDTEPLGSKGYQVLYLERPDLEITLPAEFVAFTRGMSPDDPAFAQMDYTPEYMAQILESGELYLDAIAPDGSCEVLVMTIDYPYGDLNYFSDVQVEDVLKSRRELFESEGSEWIDGKVIQHYQAKFLEIDYSTKYGLTTLYAREYYTLYDDKIISITMTSMTGELTREQKDILSEIIRNLQFGTESTAEDTSFTSSLSTKYRDSQTGLGLTIPTLWEEANIGKKNPDYTAKFTNELYPDSPITLAVQDLYGSGRWQTLWPELSVDGREEVDHALLTGEVVAELIGCEVSQIASTRYGDREYFRILWYPSVKVSGKMEKKPACTLVRCENGYLYVFQYVGEVNDPGFSQFRRMVAKAAYSDVPEDTEQPATPGAVTEYHDKLSGTVFPIPQGWAQRAEDPEFDGVEFFPITNSDTILLISCVDLYQEYLKSCEELGEKVRHKTRAEFDLVYSGKAAAADILSCKESEVSTSQYGGSIYYHIKKNVPVERNGITVKQSVVYLTRIENGFMYYFQFYGEKTSVYYTELEEMLANIRYTHADEQDVAAARVKRLWSRLSPLNLLISLLITVAVYSLPIFIYRWCIRRYPVERKKAKIIAIVYGIAAWILMSVIVFVVNDGGVAGAAVFLWSWVNYRVLIGGRDKRRRVEEPQDDPWMREPEFVEPQIREPEIAQPGTEESAIEERKIAEPCAVEFREEEPKLAEPEIAEPEPQPAEPELVETEPSKPEPAPEEEPYRFCPRCGFELIPGSRFCSRCGTSIPGK